MGIRSESCQFVCVCVSQWRQYTCRAKRITTWTSTIHTKSIRNQRPIFNYQIYNKNTQAKRYITRYVTHIEKETEPIPLLENWWRGIENMENMRICVWTLWFRKGFRQERQWIETNVRVKNWKHLKTDLYAQNTQFSWLNQVTSKSLGQVARTLKAKILKNLSKCFSRLEVLPARESRGKPRKSLSLLATRPSTREQVARLSHEKH